MFFADKIHTFLNRIEECRSISFLKKAGVEFHADRISFRGKCFLYIDRTASVTIGDGFLCNSGHFAIDNGINSLICAGSDARLTIGENSGMSSTAIQCHQEIIIGDNVNIGAGCLIMDSDFHSKDYMIRRDRLLDRNSSEKASVHIGDDVFIGARSTICKGVSIGERSIIAAGSVVVTNVPADCLAGGNPAKVIKSLI